MAQRRDVMLVDPEPGEDGSRAGIRLTDTELQVGVLKAVQDGQPLNGDLVRLTHRNGSLFDVEELYSSRSASEDRSGPAQVNSEEFRTGWDRVFGQKTVGVA